MPVLNNARHERFAQYIAKGASQHEAYRRAGYLNSGDRANAGKLARKPEVAARVAELLEKQSRRIGITIDALVAELDEMLCLARRVKHPAAGVGAILAKGKLLGLITDKVEVEGTVRKPARRPTEDRQMSMDDWAKKFAPPDQGGPLQ